MQKMERSDHATRAAPNEAFCSIVSAHKQAILVLAIVISMTAGASPGAAASSERPTHSTFVDAREQAGAADVRLADTVVRWLSAHFPLPQNYENPRIEIVSSMQMAAVRYRGLSSSLQARVVSDDQWMDRMRDTVALYEDASRTIYLREGWTASAPADVSVLVHEMVHHLQNLAGEKFQCAQAREKFAYAAQKKWLEEAGLDLFELFKIDPMTLMLRTACF